MQHPLRTWLVVAGTLTACSAAPLANRGLSDGGEPNVSASDAGSSDAGALTYDGASSPSDAAVANRDGAAGKADAGTHPADGGTVDGAQLAADGAANGHDSGASSADGGTGDAAASGIALGILPDFDNAESNTGGIAGFVSRTGVVPALVSNYMGISSGSFDTGGAESFMDQALAAGVPVVSISLSTGDSDVPAGTQSQITAAVAYGRGKGLTVQVRFGYEMNGSWSPSFHGGDPTIFKTTWAEVASAVHAANGEMVWSPNIVAGGISAYNSVLPTDPTTIDIVGLDFYHFNGSATDLSISPSELDSAFASIYPLVEQLAKPFVLTETAVSYFDQSGTWPTATVDEVSEKRAWLDALVSPSLKVKYPLYRGFVWFDYNKNESSEYRDFSISQQTIEASMFTSWVASQTGALTLGK